MALHLKNSRSVCERLWDGQAQHTGPLHSSLVMRQDSHQG